MEQIYKGYRALGYEGIVFIIKNLQISLVVFNYLLSVTKSKSKQTFFMLNIFFIGVAPFISLHLHNN
jgi:hypothetical protein